jgi:23S rRNA (guanine745-N1)-methyltransferase
MDNLLRCLVCKSALTKGEREYTCLGGHRFDRARQGYVNLLQSQRSSARNHGDDRAMILARRNFLEKGYYGPLRDCLKEKVYFYTAKKALSLMQDAGKAGMPNPYAPTIG